MCEGGEGLKVVSCILGSCARCGYECTFVGLLLVYGCRVVHDLMVTVLRCVPDCTIMFVSIYIHFTWVRVCACCVCGRVLKSYND